MIYQLLYSDHKPTIYVARITERAGQSEFQRHFLVPLADTKQWDEEYGVRTFQLINGLIYEAYAGSLGRSFFYVAGDETIPMTTHQVRETFRAADFQPASSDRF